MKNTQPSQTQVNSECKGTICLWTQHSHLRKEQNQEGERLKGVWEGRHHGESLRPEERFNHLNHELNSFSNTGVKK